MIKTKKKLKKVESVKTKKEVEELFHEVDEICKNCSKPIDKLTMTFGNEDMNKVVEKINEIIEKYNGTL